MCGGLVEVGIVLRSFVGCLLVHCVVLLSLMVSLSVVVLLVLHLGVMLCSLGLMMRALIGSMVDLMRSILLVVIPVLLSVFLSIGVVSFVVVMRLPLLVDMAVAPLPSVALRSVVLAMTFFAVHPCDTIIYDADLLMESRTFRSSIRRVANVPVVSLKMLHRGTSILHLVRRRDEADPQ